MADRCGRFAPHPQLDAPTPSRFSAPHIAAMGSSMTLMRQSALASKHEPGHSCGLIQGLVERRPSRLLAKPFISLDLPPGVFASHYLARFRFSLGCSIIIGTFRPVYLNSHIPSQY